MKPLNKNKSTDGRPEPTLKGTHKQSLSQSKDVSRSSISDPLLEQIDQAPDQPCEKNMEKVLIWTAGLFGGQSIIHIMGMAHHHETPNATDPIAFGFYSLMLTLGILLLKANRASYSDALPEQVIPVLSIIALAGFFYALIQVGIDDWYDTRPDIPTNTTISSP